MAYTPERLVQEMQTLPSPPHVYQKLNEVIDDPRSSNQKIANVLSEDAGLAARVLRLANSALFGFPSKIDTITRAITVIGTAELRDLALATSVVRMFDGVPHSRVSMESFWRHSIACGLMARILAALRHEPNMERFFVAGLLHDIGRLVLFLNLPARMGEAMAEAERSEALLYETERRVLGFDHAAAGGALLAHWRLPEPTVKAVACHHQPDLAREAAADAAVVHVADLIVNALQRGSSGERYVPPLNGQAWAQLGLPGSALATAVHQLDKQYEETVQLLLRA
jgi:HD-like signal output (HDOD) protein